MSATFAYAGPVSPLGGEGVWIWVGAILTIAIFSFLWRDNPLYRFAEHLFVGVSIGYILVVVWNMSLKPDLVLPLFFGREKSAYDPAISVQSGQMLLFTRENWDVEQSATVAVGPDEDADDGHAVVEVRMKSGANRIGTERIQVAAVDGDRDPGGEEVGTASGEAAEPAASPDAGLPRPPVEDDALRFIVSTQSLSIPEGETAELGVRLSKAPDQPIRVVVTRADRKPLGERLVLVIPLILGLMLASRIVPKAAWMSRITIALLVGMGAGAAIPTVLHARVLTQAANTVSIPLIAMTPEGFSLWGTLNNLVLIVGIITSLIYFWFSIEHKGAVGVAAKTGIYFLMVGFGAAFGYTVMARVSLLIGRVLFLLKDWLQIPIA